MEIWKGVKGYSNYQVSNLGRIKSLNGGGDKILKDRITHSGYNRVCLYKNGDANHLMVHRIVCQEFIRNTHNKKTVNHKNLNKVDNRVENLEWMTHKENNQHAIDNGKNKKHTTVIKLSDTVEIYHSIIDASKATGICRKAISNCIRGKSKTSGGYKWEEYEFRENNNDKRRY